MSEQQSYTYTILRYVHDVSAGEFVNVGVVLHETATGKVRARFQRSVRRIRAVFPEVDRNDFVTAISAVERGVKLVDVAIRKHADLASDAGVFSRRVLPVSSDIRN